MSNRNSYVYFIHKSALPVPSFFFSNMFFVHSLHFPILWTTKGYPNVVMFMSHRFCFLQLFWFLTWGMLFSGCALKFSCFLQLIHGIESTYQPFNQFDLDDGSSIMQLKQRSSTLPNYEMDCAHCQHVCCHSPSSSECGCLEHCGPCNFCERPWVLTPQHFETPTEGNFKISIQVPPLPGLNQYLIDEVQVTMTSMNLDTSSWKIDLVGPDSSRHVILKEYTAAGGDLDCTFSDSPCAGCVFPFEALSAFKTTSALGNWTLEIEAGDSGRHGFVSWVSLAFRLNCMWSFDPDVHWSNITEHTTYNNTPEDVTFNNTFPNYEMDCAHCHDVCCNSPLSKLASASECGCLEHCGPCNFCERPWVLTPQHFETPTEGNFKISIQVPPLPGLNQYLIDEVQVTMTSMNLDTSSWKIDLVGPDSSRHVILKEYTAAGGDLDCTFSDSPCAGCVFPFEALSAFKTTSALGNWTLEIEAGDSGRHGFVSWVSLAFRLNCMWSFDPDVHWSNITEHTTYNNTPEDVTFNNTFPNYEMDCAHCHDVCCNSPLSKLASASECGCLEHCGPCNFCERPWVLTPQQFETPTEGNFNVSIQVPQLPGLNQYLIDEVQVTMTSMGMNTSSWKIDLVGPGSAGDIILQKYTAAGGDLDAIFSDSQCAKCISPFEALSAFNGKSALGNWTVEIEAEDSGRDGFLSWVSLELKLNCW